MIGSQKWETVTFLSYSSSYSYSYSNNALHPIPLRPHQSGNQVEAGIAMQRIEYEDEDEDELI